MMQGTESEMATHDHESIAASLERFVREHFQIAGDDPFFSRTVHLWEEGYVDSAGVVQTIAYLEGLYGVELSQEAVSDPAFTNIDGIARMIASLLEG
jgi:acyl carrier protein